VVIKLGIMKQEICMPAYFPANIRFLTKINKGVR